ncbi:nuclear transport factor 2 family protein [Agromyces aerolatus]|uniref:nuclear transport factor 2 family protein n=1 Tax=Agromyces sp. LY-1074 TaxID=3074080 RepID=UPI00286008E6|nr:MULTISPECIES: nuclear transport factor 2 family protein [unclassified Agromyces]MDR5699125.1 nuclear transport factor 2 family protein [Agromyces sp. LY-1074]MDR5705096.1 nuclear transport factor 2 family protein [Agromyces sp. LY-1358]
MTDTAISTETEIESIRQLKARYFRTLDTKDWDGFKAVFTEDAAIGPVDNGFTEELIALRSAESRAPVTASGIDAFVERVATNIGPLISTHHGHQPEIELTSEDEATGIWAMEDVLVWPADGYRLRGTGHYWETYRKVDGEWKIASLKLTRLYVYVERIDPLA